MPPVTGSGPPSLAILIIGSVALSPATWIAESVAPAPRTHRAASDLLGSTTYVVTLCAMTPTQVVASVLTSPLVADAVTSLIAKTTSSSLPSHPCIVYANHSSFLAVTRREI
ncbi:hypothetical protein HOY80DRAFT_1056798 [Tuber brumale]|nr:hypothetical protein HOY80DRAFT_1056798 [Tuber brumale]